MSWFSDFSLGLEAGREYLNEDIRWYPLPQGDGVAKSSLRPCERQKEKREKD